VVRVAGRAFGVTSSCFTSGWPRRRAAAVLSPCGRVGRQDAVARGTSGVPDAVAIRVGGLAASAAPILADTSSCLLRSRTRLGRSGASVRVSVADGRGSRERARRRLAGAALGEGRQRRGANSL
jgi:hypothetical protein